MTKPSIKSAPLGLNYLGAMITADVTTKEEICRRIALSKDAFNELRNILTNRKLSLKIKILVVQTYVWSVLFYGVEAWTLTADTRRNLEAADNVVLSSDAEGFIRR